MSNLKIDYIKPEPLEEKEYGINSLFSKGYLDGRHISADSITTSQLNFTPTDSDNIIATINASTEGITIDADNISISGSTTFDSGYDPTDKVDELGGSYDSASSGARVRIFPDANTGIQIVDDDSNDVFKAIVGGTDIGDVIFGDETSNKFLKWDKSEGTLNLGSASTINGRVASTISGAINSSGDFINDVINSNLNTSTKTILSDFTFTDTDYAGAFKTGDITWNASGEVTGGSGILMNAKGLVGANSGSTTFSIDATTGNATFYGTLSAASGTLGTITAGTFQGVEFSQTFGVTAGMDLNKGDAVIIADGSDIVLIGQGATDDTELEMGIDGDTVAYAQPVIFHKDFAEGDTFKVELLIKGGTSVMTNDLAVYVYANDATDKEPLTAYNIAYLSGSISVFDFNYNAYQKLTADFTLGAGKSIDKDTIYWIGVWSNESYKIKANSNLYYQYYNNKEFTTDYGVRKAVSSVSGGAWQTLPHNLEMYFKVLIPTTDGDAYLASPWGVEDDFPKIAIGLSNDSYNEDDTINAVTFGTLQYVSVEDLDNLGDNVYLDYYGGKLTGDPVDILRTYAIGQAVSESGGDYEIKLNIENNLLLRVE